MSLLRYDAIDINGYGFTPSVSGGITPAGAAGWAVCKARQAMNPEHTEVCEDFIDLTATPPRHFPVASPRLARQDGRSARRVRL